MDTEQLIGRHAYGLAIRRIRLEGHTSSEIKKDEEQLAFTWIRRKLDNGRDKNRPDKEWKECIMNSASISVLSRKIMATEWARATGREIHNRSAFSSIRSAFSSILKASSVRRG